MTIPEASGYPEGARAVRPFLKWAGGKQWLAERISVLATRTCGRYYEPFVGGGSVFFAIRPSEAFLSDLNPRLIEVYQIVRDKPVELIERLGSWHNTRDQYYAIRASEYRNRVDRAAQFIFLNKTCWNGLYRVNRAGRFNVPYGHYLGRSIFCKDELIRASNALRAASLKSLDFEDAVHDAGAGDFVYLDPPYTTLHTNNGFRRYNERLFSWEDQVRLSTVALELAGRGSHVVVSNADHAETRALYPSFSCARVARKSRIAANPRYRVNTCEVILSSFPINVEED